MKIYDKIRNEKVQYNIYKEAVKISALSSGKIEKYDYLTDKEIPSDQKRMIEQAKFTYFLLGKALEKQTKSIEDQGKEQVKAIEDHGKQFVQSNVLIKKDFNIARASKLWFICTKLKKKVWKILEIMKIRLSYLKI